MTVHSAVCPVRVGRTSELQVLRGLAARKQMALISGPAGIGKSRLTAEALSIADDLGYTSLVGHCGQDQIVPYAPFVSAIRRRTRTLESEEVSALFQGPALLAAALLPEVAKTVGLPSEPPRQDDLFVAIWQLLRRLSSPQGAVLVLEDLHWADTDSLRLLTYLAQEASDLPIWIVGTYRNDEIHRRHPFAGVLAELGRERRFEEIALQPLERSDLAVMIGAIFDGTDVGEEFVDAMDERTQGNPFFVEELLKVLIERGDLYVEQGDWARRDLADIEMPFTVRETLLARSRSMPPDALAVMQLASLSGDRLDVDVLAAAAEIDGDRAEQAIAEGIRLQLLAERRDGSRSTYVFRHALTREALADELVGPDRRRAHLQIARAIERVHDRALDDRSAELSDHYLAAGEIDKAILYGRRAARAAAASFAVDEAGRRYERTLGLMSIDSPERLPTLIEAAESVIEAPDRRLAVSFASEARTLAQTGGDAIAEARALGVLSRDAMWSGDTRRSMRLLQEAFELIRGRDDFEEATIRAQLTFELTRVDEIEQATSLIPEGIELATRSSNYRALSSLYVSRMMNASETAEFEESLELARAAARATRDGQAEFLMTHTAGYICTWRGDFSIAYEQFTHAGEMRERVAPEIRYSDAGLVWLLSLMGRYDEAVALASDISWNKNQVPTRIVTLTGLYEVAERRDDPETDAILAELEEVSILSGETQRSVPTSSARARLTLLREGLGHALPKFWEVLSLTTSARGRGSHWLFSPDLARALLEEERADELAAWSSAIQSVTDSDPHVHNRAANALVKGYLAAGEGDVEGATDSYHEAITAYHSMPCPAREAEALLGLADLERRGGRGATSGASARQALAVAVAIGARALIDVATTALRRAELPTVLTTVLFTDIVGSTKHLAEVGDRPWRSLLERHDVVVRREIERYGGRAIATTGDGFLAAFDAPIHAIRAVVAMQEALSTIGVSIRAGVHFGECQVTESNLAGMPVHVAARVCALAGPGELFLTSIVRELVTGSGLTFTDRGRQPLKGVPDEWQIFSIP